ncbi:MAG: hypothetical protein ACTSX9_08200 [Candidatus Njordarchaeales archaeon]
MFFAYGKLRIYKLKSKKKLRILGEEEYEWEQTRITIKQRGWWSIIDKLRELDGKGNWSIDSASG